MLAKAAASNPCPWSAHASLVARRLDSPESYLLTFELLLDDCPSELLLPGQHLVLAPHEADGDEATPVGESRPYTPIEMNGRSLTILVKSYSPPAEHPWRGAFSSWLTSLRMGGCVQISGPFGAVALDLQPQCSSHLHLLEHGMVLPLRRLVLIAGGSGATPVVQTLHAACARLGTSSAAVDASRHLPSQHPLEIWVLISDRTPHDSVLVSQISALHTAHPELIVSVERTYTALPTGLPLPPDAADTRRIDAPMVRDLLPPPSADTVALVSGPPSFESAVGRSLAEVGHAHVVLLSSGEVSSPSLEVRGTPGAGRVPSQLVAALRCCVQASVAPTGKAIRDEATDRTDEANLCA